MFTTNYKRLELLAPKPKKKKRKKSGQKLQITKPAKPIKKSRRYPTERELLRKLDSWV